MNPRLNAVDPLNFAILLAMSAVAVSCPVDTTEDILVAYSLPPKVLGPHGRLRIRTLWTFTNSVNLKSFKVRFGGIAGTAYLATSTSSAGIITLENEFEIANRGAVNSQVGSPGGGGQAGGIAAGFGGNGVSTSAVDTDAAPTSIVITGQKATGAEVLTLESWRIDLLSSL